MDGRGAGKSLGGVGEGETIITIICMKKSISNKKKGGKNADMAAVSVIPQLGRQTVLGSNVGFGIVPLSF